MVLLTCLISAKSKSLYKIPYSDRKKRCLAKCQCIHEALNLLEELLEQVVPAEGVQQDGHVGRAVAADDDLRAYPLDEGQDPLPGVPETQIDKEF